MCIQHQCKISPLMICIQCSAVNLHLPPYWHLIPSTWVFCNRERLWLLLGRIMLFFLPFLLINVPLTPQKYVWCWQFWEMQGVLGEKTWRGQMGLIFHSTSYSWRRLALWGYPVSLRRNYYTNQKLSEHPIHIVGDALFYWCCVPEILQL